MHPTPPVSGAILNHNERPGASCRMHRLHNMRTHAAESPLLFETAKLVPDLLRQQECLIIHADQVPECMPRHWYADAVTVWWGPPCIVACADAVHCITGMLQPAAYMVYGAGAGWQHPHSLQL